MHWTLKGLWILEKYYKLSNKAIDFNVSMTSDERLRLAEFRRAYSHLSNSRGGWNKRRGDAKVAKSINVEVGLNVEGGSLTFVHIHLEYSIALWFALLQGLEYLQHVFLGPNWQCLQRYGLHHILGGHQTWDQQGNAWLLDSLYDVII